jgi:DNA-binding MarR family transcriptional regulator
MIGSLREYDFDLLEYIDLLGGEVSAHCLGARRGMKPQTCSRALQRARMRGLLDSRDEIENRGTNNGRRTYYRMSDTGRRLYREAWAALDAACEEAA